MIKFMSIKEHDDINSDDYAVVVFFNHCDFHCKNCQNAELMKNKKQYDFTKDIQQEIINIYKQDIYGEYGNLVLSGGDPYSTINRKETYNFIKKFKEELPNIKIWIYTGYKLEQVDKNYLKYTELKTNDNYYYDIKLATSNQKIYKKGVDY